MSDTPPPDTPLLYTPREAAELLRISRSQMYVMLAAGEIKSITVPGTRSRRIPRTVLEEFVARQLVEQTDPAHAA